jgi:tetratricopeptide (TPR) repeat protein
LALIFRNTPALIIAALCVGGAAALGLSYFAALGEFLGEERRVSYTPHGSSGRELYHEGRGHYAEGRIFLAAQCWARAIGREPGNAAYLHALGLALARLGQRERALAELARAQAAAPDDREIQASYTMVQKGT